ncbi:formylglycine-generating enzyme [Galendromus occidentalis]|uniref:Formylglycine-generating enzyme n=1 Tax=Galendromus occidentalis TaxID=34638 RepID=A0AAJ6QPI7_9ACAR|nr:formylglycine-generating enzyme [Galendromus occidentalis]
MRFSCFFIIVSVSCEAAAASDCGCSESRSATRESPNDQGSRSGKNFVEESPSIPIDSVCRAALHEKMVLVKGGEFIMGTNRPVILADGEHPARVKNISSFWLDATEVSNEAFEKFVHETGHLTDAETIGDSYVLGSTITESKAIQGAVQAAPWWFSVFGASWRNPEGPGSNIIKRMKHPVVHVSWRDAERYCEHYGKRLPNEAEWEMACKRSLGGKRFPWNDEVTDAENQRSANIWQGQFPNTNTKKDGYEGTAPVDTYDPYPGLPLKNMIGNVWEWTADAWTTDHGTKPDGEETRRVKKGGSFMCHASYCFRYRCEARSENTLDTSSVNVGFRCAADALDSRTL